MASSTKKIRTAEEVKEHFRKRGETLSGWAKDNGFKYNTVLAVLNGQQKGHRGEAHKVAVALGMKEAA